MAVQDPQNTTTPDANLPNPNWQNTYVPPVPPEQVSYVPPVAPETPPSTKPYSGSVFVVEEDQGVDPIPYNPPPPAQESEPIVQQSVSEPTETQPVFEAQVLNVPQTPLVEPQSQTVPVLPPDNTPPPISEPFYKKLNIKVIIAVVGVVIALLGVAFFVKSMFFAKETKTEDVTLTYWGYREDSANINALIAEYELENKGVKINYVKQSKEDYRERLVNSLARGSGPDIFSFHNTWLPMLGNQLSTVPPGVLDQKAYQETFYPSIVRDLTRGDQIYGMPISIDGLGLYVNEAIFEAEGKSLPSTWDELRQVAFLLTKKDESGRIERAGVALGRTDNVDHWEDILSLMLLQNRVNFAEFTGRAATEPIAYFTVFTTQDGIWDKSLPQSVQSFAAGKVAMVFAPSWKAAEIKKLNPGLRFRVIPMPQLPKNSPADTDIAWAAYWAEGVWNKGKSSNEAWKFVKFLTQKESLTKLYQSSVATSGFGFPYSRLDMASITQDDVVMGAYIKQAPVARSWYLASNTNDGQTGINSKLAQVFKVAIDSIVEERGRLEDLLPTITQGLGVVLLEYGLEK